MKPTPSVSAEARLVHWLLRDPAARSVLDAELWLPLGAVPHYGVALDKLTGLPPMAEKIGVLVCDPHTASQATVLEVKRLQVSAAALDATARLSLPELAMTIRHVNRLAEIGFHRLWLLVCLVIDGGDWSSDSDRLRATNVLRASLDHGPILQLVHASAGVALAAVPGASGGADLCGVPSLLVGRWAASVPQQTRVTAMVGRLLRPASA